MNKAQSDRFSRWLDSDTSRRSVFGLLAGLGIGGADLLVADAAKKGGKGPKKRNFCLNGTNVTAKNKKKKRRLRSEGAVRGRCPSVCTPVCPVGACGSDGCGGTCGCAAGSVCALGVCQTCTVTCVSDAATCGNDLSAAVTAGGDVYVCPGRYATLGATGFVTLLDTRIYGSGSGSDQTRDSILDAENGFNKRVVTLANSAVVTLANLRITGGNAAGGLAGGVDSSSTGLLTVDGCAIVGNVGQYGGITHSGPLRMTNSLVAENTSPVENGGIHLMPQGANDASSVSNSVISGNDGATFGGIEFVTASATQTLTVDSASKIVDNTITAPAGDRAGGIGMVGVPLGVTNATGATITGNTEPQCLNVTGCP